MTPLCTVLFVVHAACSVQCTVLADGEMRLNGDLDVLCWRGEHLRYSLGVGVFALFYPVGMPLMLTWVIFKMQKPGAEQKYKWLVTLVQRYRPGLLVFEVLQLGFKVSEAPCAPRTCAAHPLAIHSRALVCVVLKLVA